MAYVKAICLTTYGSRPVERRIGSVKRTDTFVRCRLQADDLNDGDDLPTMGALIDGLDDMAIVDAGSTIEVLGESATYVMGQDLNWYKRGGAVG